MGQNDESQELPDYRGLMKREPFLAITLAIGLGSLAGIPPLAGFIGKVFLFIAAFKAGLSVLLGVAVIGVVISIFYYFSWIREAFFASKHPEPTDEREHAGVSIIHKFALGTLAATVIVLGIYQGFLGQAMF